MTAQLPYSFAARSDQAQLPYLEPDTQVKNAGTVINQLAAGRNRILANASIESVNFQTGTTGFQLKGDGTAEFNNITVRGTVVGTFKTAASGQRIEILVGSPALMTLYSGNAAESTPASLGLVDAGTYPKLTMDNAAFTNGVGQRVQMTEPGGSYGRGLFLEGGKPTAGTRGIVSLQPASEGRILGRGRDVAPIKNCDIAAHSGNTMVGGGMSNNGTTEIYTIAASEQVLFALGAGQLTLPASGFANGVLFAVCNCTGPNGTIINIDTATTTKTVLHFLGWDAVAAAAINGNYTLSYIAIGW